MNLVVLNGRLTRDPELKFGQSGKAYSRFSIAVDRPFQSSSDKNSQTADFINCVAFGKTAEFIGEYFRKGRKILLNGKLQMSQYESEGKKVTTRAAPQHAAGLRPLTWLRACSGSRRAARSLRGLRLAVYPDPLFSPSRPNPEMIRKQEQIQGY